MPLDGVRLVFEQQLDETRLAARRLCRTPGFALAAILTLALGIGAATSVLSVAYGVLFAPLPVRDAAHVVVMWGHNPNKQPEHFPLSGPEYMAFAREARSFSHIAAVDYQGALPRLVQLGDTAASIRAAMVTGDFFEVLGARPLIGRLLRPDDDVYGTPAAIVLSEPLWRTAFGADPSIVGKVTKVYTNPVRIVGVLAGALDYPRGAQMWGSYTAIWPKSDTTPGLQGFHDIVARLAPGMSPVTSRQELAAFFARPAEPHSGARLVAGQYLQPVAEPITDAIVGDVRHPSRTTLPIDHKRARPDRTLTLGPLARSVRHANHHA
jgi:putative ABC transport system permease protein